MTPEISLVSEIERGLRAIVAKVPGFSEKAEEVKQSATVIANAYVAQLSDAAKVPPRDVAMGALLLAAEKAGKPMSAARLACATGEGLNDWPAVANQMRLNHH